MADMNQAPGAARRPWSGSKEELLTVVLAISRTHDYEPEEVWDEMDRYIAVDIHPYADFQSMLLALEKDCDVDGYLAQLPEWRRLELGTILVTNDGQLDMTTNSEGAKGAGLHEFVLQLGKPQKAFVGKLRSGKMLTWEGSLVEFMGLVLLTMTQTVRPPADPDVACEVICRRYRRFINVDFGRFKNFHALYKAHKKDFNEMATLRRDDRVKAAYRNVFTLRLHEGDPAVKAFKTQGTYISQAAELFREHWPEPDAGKLMLILSVIFVTDEMLDAVLGK